LENGELKVVLHLTGSQALLGVQEKGTDPVVERVEAATLEEALGAVPGVLHRARERWAESPRNPAHQAPPAPPPQATAPPASRSARREESGEGQMQRLI
jgi:hypothetical protein